MDFLTLSNLDSVSTLTVLSLVALSIITDKLVWHTRLKKAEARAERWEQVAVQALTAGATAGVHAAEVAVGIVSSIPDPQGDRNRAAAAERDGTA